MITLFDDETLPTALETDGGVFEFHSDFRQWIRFETLLTDSDIPDAEKRLLMTPLIFPDIPPFDVTEYLMWFYCCGKPPRTKKKDRGKAVKGRCYSFEYDEDMIYSAFMQVYGIDLGRIEYLHWWKFRALFTSLPEDCKLIKVIGYRNAEIGKDMSPERAKFLKEMKETYALPKSLSEQQKTEKLKKILKDSKRP